MLRGYQQELISDLRKSIRDGYSRPIAVLPTGGGKTFTFTHIVKGAVDRNRKVLILTDRIELLKQAGGALTVYGMNPIELKAGTKPYLGGILYTAMVETLNRRLKKKNYQYWLAQMDLIIIDECHMRSFDKIFPYFSPESRVIGFTATPRREGRKNQLGEYYNKLVIGVEIDYLVDNKYLSEPMYYGVEADLSGVRTKAGDYNQDDVADRFSKAKLYKGVVENYNRIARGTKTLVFSSNIASSKELLSEFITQGLPARHLDSNMSEGERTEILNWFKRSSNGILCNVGILTKGFDEPTIETIILYRATKSVPLFLQMVGRGSRTHEPSRKFKFNVLDFGGNLARHGFWHDRRVWSLDVLPEKETDGAPVLKQCKNCEAFIPARSIACPECGFVDQKEKEEQEFAELKLLNPKQLREKADGESLETKIDMAKKKLIKPFWVIHNLKTFEEVQRFVSAMGWNPYWYEYNHHRFWWSKEYLERKNSGQVLIKTR